MMYLDNYLEGQAQQSNCSFAPGVCWRTGNLRQSLYIYSAFLVLYHDACVWPQCMLGPGRVWPPATALRLVFGE